MVLEEPEARLPDGQVRILHISNVRAKEMVNGEDRGLGWARSRSYFWLR